MIMIGPWNEVLLAVVTAIIGCILLAAALEGYLYLFGRLSVFSRTVIFGSGFLFLYPDSLADISGLGILILFILLVKAGAIRQQVSVEAART